MQDPSIETLYLHDRIARWRDGDRVAADELLRTCAARLDRLARKMLRNFPVVRGHADTADVLQGACMRLLTALRSVYPSSTREFFSLAGLQMRRELLDLAAQASRRKAVGLDQAGEISGTAEDDLELWCAFHKAVDGLPTEQREVFGLVFYHGWTQQRVGDLLGVCERTVRRHWVAASARLHTVLGGHFPLSDD